MEFSDFNILFEYLVQYYFGTYAILGLIIVSLVLILLISNGIPFKYSILFVFPLLAFFVSFGWFGSVSNSQWIINAVLVGIALIYSYMIIKIMG